MSMFGEPVDEVDSIRSVFFHHAETCALKLLFSLEEIAGVCPYEGVVCSDDGCAVGAVGGFKSREPFAASPVMRWNFRLVGVCSGDDTGVNAVLLHGLAQVGEIGEILFFHIKMMLCLHAGEEGPGGLLPGWKPGVNPLRMANVVRLIRIRKFF